jgi:phage terminase large subunit-like protein
LQHSKGEWAGRTFELAPWQQFILWALFGWKRKADGMRRFRIAFVFVPRKNGKSTLMAGLGLFLLVADGEPGAEIYSAATKRDQAKLSWVEAVRMRNASPALAELVQYWKSSDTLDMESTNSKYQPLGADANTMDGLNVHGALIDELHAHPTSEVVDVLQTATGSRRQPLQFEITTAGSDLHGIGHEHYDYGKKILDQVFDDDTWFVFIAELDEGDNWQNERTWAKANPNLGVSVKLDDLQRKAVEARNRPAALNNFLCKHLDKWVQQEERWIALEKWDACAAEFDQHELLGLTCYGGLDLSSKIDITAFVLVFPTEDGGYRQVSWYWIPEESMTDREQRDRVPYGVWRDAGWVEATPGNVIDYERIKAKIGELAELYDIREIGFDPWSATQIAIQLGEQGLEMVEISQRYSTLSEPSKEFEQLILGRRIQHDGNPVMRWMIDCVSVLTDSADNIRPAKPDRRKSGKRIDGVAATVNGLFCAMRNKGNDKSVYEERGLLTL